jgi:ADP-ribose pyrophosphatase
MPPKPWRTLSSRLVYENPWTRVREDIAEMPSGKTTLYGVIECGDCVGVLPFLDDDRVVMVRQYRYVFGEYHRWEMPTGGVKSGESLEEAARREMREEVGYDARELQLVSTYFTSKSIMQEIGHLFIGRGLTQVQAVPDETEFLEVAIFPFQQVLEMVIESEIRDSMTVIAVLLAAQLQNKYFHKPEGGHNEL